jgi:hypothetical protein
MKVLLWILALSLSPLSGYAQTFRAPLSIPKVTVSAPASLAALPALNAAALPALLQPAVLLPAIHDGAWDTAGDGALAAVRGSGSLAPQKIFASAAGQAVPVFTAAPAQGAADTTFQPRDQEPKALLPDGKAVPPDSYIGGFPGTDIPPDEVVRNGGFTARGPQEDWRLKEHSEAKSEPKSAFRGTTPFVTAPDGNGGAALWADEGGWVYELHGVPTWDVNSDLDGRVETPGGYRGNLMHGEYEYAVPAKIPIECIVRWGQVSTTSSGTPYVSGASWTPNPRYDLAQCLRFWGMAH